MRRKPHKERAKRRVHNPDRIDLSHNAVLPGVGDRQQHDEVQGVEPRQQAATVPVVPVKPWRA
jgi:hypothetical protein